MGRKEDKFKEDKAWSDSYMNQVRLAMSTHFLQLGSFKEDTEMNTDLRIIDFQSVKGGIGAGRISSRLRHYDPMYPDNVDIYTMRYSRPSGMKTEFPKVMEGFGDFFFYGIMNRGILAVYKIYCLAEFRIWIKQYQKDHNGDLPAIKRNNTDDSSDFLIFEDRDTPKEVILCSHIDHEALKSVPDKYDDFLSIENN